MQLFPARGCSSLMKVSHVTLDIIEAQDGSLIGAVVVLVFLI